MPPQVLVSEEFTGAGSKGAWDNQSYAPSFPPPAHDTASPALAITAVITDRTIRFPPHGPATFLTGLSEWRHGADINGASRLSESPGNRIGAGENVHPFVGLACDCRRQAPDA